MPSCAGLGRTVKPMEGANPNHCCGATAPTCNKANLMMSLPKHFQRFRRNRTQRRKLTAISKERCCNDCFGVCSIGLRSGDFTKRTETSRQSSKRRVFTRWNHSRFLLRPEDQACSQELADRPRIAQIARLSIQTALVRRAKYATVEPCNKILNAMVDTANEDRVATS